MASIYDTDYNAIYDRIKSSNPTIENPYTRGLLESQVTNGNTASSLLTDAGVQAEVEKRAAYLKSAVVDPLSAEREQALTQVEKQYQRAGKLSSSGATASMLRASEQYGANIASALATGVLNIYGQVDTAASAERQRLLEGGQTQTQAETALTTAGLEAETSRYNTQATLNTQTAIAQLQSDTDIKIANIQASTELSAQEKQLQIAQIQSATNEKIANIQAQAQIQSANIGAGAEIQVANIQTSSAQNIAKIQADTTLTQTEKELAVAREQISANLQIANLNAQTQIDVAIEQVKGATDVATINSLTDKAIAQLQAQMQERIANIDANATLQAADKELYKTKITNDTNTAIAKLQTQTQTKIAELEAATASKGMTSAETIATIQATTDQKIAELNANTTLTVSQRTVQVQYAQLQNEVQIATAQLTNAKDIATAQNATNTAIANIQAATDTAIANINADTTLSVQEKQEAIAQMQVNAQVQMNTANNAQSLTELRLQLASAADITTANNNSAQAVATLNANTQTLIENIRANTTLSEAEVQRQIALVQAQNNIDVANITAQTDLATTTLQIKGATDVATINSLTDKAIANLNAKTQTTIAQIEANTTLTAQEKAAQIARIQADTDLKITTMNNASNERIANLNAQTQIDTVKMTELYTDPATGQTMPKWMYQLKQQYAETINPATNRPYAVEMVESQIAADLKKTDLTIQANWDLALEQIKSAESMQLVDNQAKSNLQTQLITEQARQYDLSRTDELSQFETNFNQAVTEFNMNYDMQYDLALQSLEIERQQTTDASDAQDIQSVLSILNNPAVVSFMDSLEGKGDAVLSQTISNLFDIALTGTFTETGDAETDALMRDLIKQAFGTPEEKIKTLKGTITSKKIEKRDTADGTVYDLKYSIEGKDYTTTVGLNDAGKLEGTEVITAENGKKYNLSYANNTITLTPIDTTGTDTSTSIKGNKTININGVESVVRNDGSYVSVADYEAALDAGETPKWNPPLA